FSGAGGSSEGAAGGRAGDISVCDINTHSNAISFVAANGGLGLVSGGAGGGLSNLNASAGDTVSMRAGNGGNAMGVGVLHTGGDGGSINNYFQSDNSGQIIQQIVAGNGGNATGLGGVGGNGGSVNDINTLGDIGLFDGTTFGANGMGGIFAGVGGH